MAALDLKKRQIAFTVAEVGWMFDAFAGDPVMQVDVERLLFDQGRGVYLAALTPEQAQRAYDALTASARNGHFSIGCEQPCAAE